MGFLGLEIKSWCACFIYGGTFRLSAHEGDNSGLVHEAKFSVGSVFFRVRVIDNGRIHEHASIGKDPVEISG